MQNRAFKLSVLNGIFFAVVVSTFHPSMVLSAFFLKLTNSTLFATLPLALMQIGWLWPQLMVSNMAEARERKMPFYVIPAGARFVFLLLMTLSTYLLGASQPRLLMIVFSLLYFVHSSCSGVCGIAFWDIIGKTVPANKRGRFMALRGFLGGILGFASGFYVRYMLSEDGPAFPSNYAYLFITAALFQAGTSLSFALVREPVTAAKKDRVPFRKHLSQGLQIFRTDRDYRLLFQIRILNSMAMLGGMVFIPYAIKKLGMPESSVGVLMIIVTCFALPSNFLWSYIGDSYGNRLLLLISTGIYLFVPVIAFASYHVNPTPIQFPLLDGYDLRSMTFILAFVVSGVAIKGRGIGDLNYLLELAPEEKRPSYLAFMSVLLAPTVFVPLLAGVIAELISFQVSFALSFVFCVLAFLLMLRLGEPRERHYSSVSSI